MKSDHQALHQGPFPVSDPTGAGDFFLNKTKKTKNIDLSQAEGGLSSFGKNCKQGRPLITVWFKLLESSLGVKQIRFTVFCTCSNTEHITLWLLWRKTQKQELCHSLISTLRAVSALDKRMWHQLHQMSTAAPHAPSGFLSLYFCSLLPLSFLLLSMSFCSTWSDHTAVLAIRTLLLSGLQDWWTTVLFLLSLHRNSLYILTKSHLEGSLSI